MSAQKKYEIVIAHYNEDLSWLKDELKSATIYSKGGDKNSPSVPCHVLPNIGREGHTYLHHIVANYDTLADVTIFLQGHIDDHISISLKDIKKRSLATKPGRVTTFPFRELELFDHWDGIPWDNYPSWKKWTSMKSVKAAKTPREYWQQFFPNTPVPDCVGFQPGALFAVHKDTIRRHTHETYKDMLQSLFLGDMADVNPETGHHMERFWLAMWDPSEYCCFDKEKDTAMVQRNQFGQLAKGRWHVTPIGVEVDPGIVDPRKIGYVVLKQSFCELATNTARITGSRRLLPPTRAAHLLRHRPAVTGTCLTVLDFAATTGGNCSRRALD